MKTNLQRLTEIIVDQLGVDSGDVKPESNLISDLGADSLDHIELVMAFEEEFEIDIPDEDAEKCLTVADCLACIKKLLPA